MKTTLKLILATAALLTAPAAVRTADHVYSVQISRTAPAHAHGSIRGEVVPAPSASPSFVACNPRLAFPQCTGGV